MTKVAVILFNLGGPDSKESIKPFLMNFFMDRNIVSLPFPLRYLLAKKISSKRSKREAATSYGFLGDKSPLLENSQAQAKSLEEKLNSQYPENIFKVFVSMRYWHPMAKEVIGQIENFQPQKLVFLPLYPQYSTTTTNSSLENFWKEVQAEDGWLHSVWDDLKVSGICCYPFNEGFIEVSADNICVSYRQARAEGHPHPRVLFSAHGLPEKTIRAGDPYQYQCEQSAEKIAKRVCEKLAVAAIDWQICYQSRVGRLKWIGPSTEEALEKAAKEKISVIIYPHAFTQEHVETLVELDIEYKEKAEEMGIQGYYRTPTVGVSDNFLNGLMQLVQECLPKTGVAAEGGVCLCPEKFGRCSMKTQRLCKR